MRKPILIPSIVITLIIILSFIPRNKNKVKLPKGFSEKFAFIPAGEIELDNEIVAINEFYLSKCEISNLKYKEYLDEIREDDDSTLLEEVSIKGELWENASSYALYSDYYHLHPAFESYPVVNITFEAATLWCEWATIKANEKWGEDYEFEYALPTREQWLLAANDGKSKMKYAWGGPNITNAKGCLLCNFKNLSAENIHYNAEIGDYQIVNPELGRAPGLRDTPDFSASVESYIKTSYGLYNMNGNVAEMISEKGIAVGGSWNSTGYDVRNESIEKFNGPYPTIGFRPAVIVTKK